MNATEKKINLAFIGAGNVAWHLAQAFTAAGHTVVAIYSRNAASREELAGILPVAQLMTTLDFTNLSVEVVFIAVPDAAIAQVATELKVAPGTIVAHTSGSQPLTVLRDVHNAQPAIFYPLQTFSKSQPVNLKQTPFFLEAEQEQVMLQLEVLAQSISDKIHKVDSEARRQLHLAAVFACNFTNHLLGISQQLLQEAGLPKELLHSLVQETTAKASQQNPYLVQTGPGIRHDSNVLEMHLHMLQQHPRLQELYQKLTESIQATNI